nr:GntR family transcriptional regulator [Ochrobactrum sp. LM19]
MTIHTVMFHWLADVKSVRRLNDLAQHVWRDMTAGRISEAEAERLDSAIHERRKALTEAREMGIPPPKSWFPVREKSENSRKTAAQGKRCPVRWARKRRLGGREALPAHLQELFTEGERAVLFVVAADHKQHGSCSSWIQQIADRAGVGKTTVRNAIRRAAALKIISVKHREQWRGKNLSNVLTIICRDWLFWMRRFRPKLGFNYQYKGVNIARPSETPGKNKSDGQPKQSRDSGPSGGLQPFARRKPQSG